jgi:hypothetical protein
MLEIDNLILTKLKDSHAKKMRYEARKIKKLNENISNFKKRKLGEINQDETEDFISPEINQDETEDLEKSIDNQVNFLETYLKW